MCIPVVGAHRAKFVPGPSSHVCTMHEICINTLPVIGINARLAPFRDASWASPLESVPANANPKPFSSNKNRRDTPVDVNEIRI